MVKTTLLLVQEKYEKVKKKNSQLLVQGNYQKVKKPHLLPQDKTRKFPKV